MSKIISKIKHFIYHKKRKGFNTRVYFCGIRIKKKFNKMSFIENLIVNSRQQLDNRICEIIKQQNKLFNDNIKKIQLMVDELTQLQNNINMFATKLENNNKLLSDNKEQIDNVISIVNDNKEQNNKAATSIINTVEREQVLYYNPYEVRSRQERGLCDIVDAPDFANRFTKLLNNLSHEDAGILVDIVNRLQAIKNSKGKLDLFNPQEKILMKNLRNYKKSILKISDDLYCYKNYFLPINHFEASVFLYKHGIDKLNNLKNLRDKSILDIGAFIGDSALLLSPLTDDKVYSFEATNENYNHLLKTIELNNLTNIVPIKTAVGAENGNIEIRYQGSGSSSSDIMVKEAKYIETCSVITIDDYVKEHNLQVGLIKVDIEGAEQDFLKGAEKTIKEQKPTMLISIYHNIDDFLDIKPMIEGWNLGYKFSIFKPVIDTISGETLLICEQ